MHTPVRQEHEEGLVLVLLDGADRFVGEVIRQVLARFKPLAGVEAHTKAHIGPEELVDRIKVLLRVDHARVFLRQIQAAFHEQALIKALVVGSHLGRAAQMPFADVDGVVAARLEQLGHGLLTRRHAQVVEVFGRAGFFLVDHNRVQAIRVGVERASNACHRAGCRRELDAKAPGIAPGQQRRARHGADRCRRIALIETHAIACDGVDVGCWDALGGMAATEGADVVAAQVIGHDHDDVRRPLRHGLHGADRSVDPGHRMVRLARVFEVGRPAQRILQDEQAIGVDANGQRCRHRQRDCQFLFNFHCVGSGSLKLCARLGLQPVVVMPDPIRHPCISTVARGAWIAGRSPQ